MITKKVTEVFSLSDENKQAIKENAQKIKSHLVASGYDDCQDFIVCNDYDYWTFAEETLKDFLPFVKEEKPFIVMHELLTEIDSAIRDLEKSIIADKYNKESLIEKIFSSKNSKIINYLLND